MHKYQNYNLVIGGAKPNRNWQACSLFGLESYGDKKKLHRSHGYTLGQLNIDGDIVEIHIWPRIAHRHQAGHWQIIADTSSTITEGESLPVESIKLPRKAQAKHALKGTTTKPFRVLLLATDTDLSETRNSIAEHLRTALGVEATKGSISPPDPSVYDLVVLLQGWWWDSGGAVKAWQKAPASRRLAFVVDEDSDWPPRRISEIAAGNEIQNFRDALVDPKFFHLPEELPEKVGAVVTSILQSRVGDDGMGLREWERAYLSFRLPAWKSGERLSAQGTC